MSYRGGVATGVVATVIVGGAAGAGWWLVTGKPAEAAKSAPPPVPATVAKTAKEDQFNTVILTPEAEQRLALRTGTVERKPVRRVRVYGGEVTVPAGRAVVVAAPVAGTLRPPPGGLPRPGEAVPAGRPVFQLLPLLTPEAQATLSASRVEADGQINNAKAQLDAAKIALDRSKRLLKDEAGSQRLVDEAQAPYDVAQEALKAATARRDLLAKVLGEVEKGTTAPLLVDCPEAGLLRTVSALPGQTVPSGAPLFEVVDLSTVWVRVPVYVGDRPDLDPAAPAAVGNLAARPGDSSHPGKPVPAPPAANPAAGTVDLVYELDNRSTAYSPGQRVGVTVPLRGEADSLTAPWAAVVYDVQGGTWVYERTAPHTYARRRVVVRYAAGDLAVLAAGPPPGTAVVTAGAAELFGTETGFSK